MRVFGAFESHYELWQHLSAEMRRAKSMALSSYGDLCQPRAVLPPGRTEAFFDPANYVEPCSAHTHHMPDAPDAWKKDVNYSRYGRHASLLLGDPESSYLWSRPVLRWPNTAPPCTQGCRKFQSVAELLDTLESF